MDLVLVPATTPARAGKRLLLGLADPHLGGRLVRSAGSVAIILYLEQCAGSHSLRISTLYEGALRVRSEQILGCRAAAGSETGPLLIERSLTGIQGIVPSWKSFTRIRQKIIPSRATWCHRRAPLPCPYGPWGWRIHPAHVLVVWAAHTAASLIMARLEGNRCLRLPKVPSRPSTLMNMARISPCPHLRGLVLCSNIETDKSEIEFEQQGLLLISVPTHLGTGWMLQKALPLLWITCWSR